MPGLKVATPFTVTLDPPKPDDKDAEKKEAKARNGNGHEGPKPEVYVFPEAGEYDDVPPEVADHWYTKLHLEGFKSPPVAMGADPRVKIMQPKPKDPAKDSGHDTGVAPAAHASGHAAATQHAPTPGSKA